jgi:hypothetical protein
LKAKGHILGDEEAQIFPTGDWSAISSFDFYSELMDQDKTAITIQEPNEQTFVIDLTKLRNQKNENEIDKIDLLQHEPKIELTETIQLAVKDVPVPNKQKLEIREPVKEISKELLELDSEPVNPSQDKTSLNPIAQKDLERIRKNSQELEAKRVAD